MSHSIKIEVQPAFVPEQSDPKRSLYLFSYCVRITNHGSEEVQVLSRHWIISDALGHVEEVEGPGVVGLQPIIKPNESFEYCSFCPLTTPTGHMRGTYTICTKSGEELKIKIPFFILSEPNHFH